MTTVSEERSTWTQPNLEYHQPDPSFLIAHSFVLQISRPISSSLIFLLIFLTVATIRAQSAEKPVAPQQESLVDGGCGVISTRTYLLIPTEQTETLFINYTYNGNWDANSGVEIEFVSEYERKSIYTTTNWGGIMLLLLIIIIEMISNNGEV